VEVKTLLSNPAEFTNISSSKKNPGEKPFLRKRKCLKFQE
jgi:hypothetical protein